MDGSNTAGSNRRTTRKSRDTASSITIGQLCAAVAYYYKLTPREVADFSGPQLIMWYETAITEIGSQANLDLEISLVPITEHPEKAVHELRQSLNQMMKRKEHGERR